MIFAFQYTTPFIFVNLIIDIVQNDLNSIYSKCEAVKVRVAGKEWGGMRGTIFLYTQTRLDNPLIFNILGALISPGTPFQWIQCIKNRYIKTKLRESYFLRLSCKQL